MWVQDLELKRSQWEEKKSYLATEHWQEISKLKAMWIQDPNEKVLEPCSYIAINSISLFRLKKLFG